MLKTSRIRPIPLLLAFFFGVLGCAGSGDSDIGSESGQVGESALPGDGEAAEVLLQDGSVTGGYAVTVLRRDGSRVPAVFRGPSKLAKLASGGDYEFHEDTLPSRVRLLEPGEELRRPGGGRP
jgi:hypothetical protein